MHDQPSKEWFDGPPVLNRRFVLYLPSQTKDGGSIPQLEEIAGGIAAMLSRRFGGATSYPATGHFGPQQESIQVIECFCDRSSWEKSSGYLFSLVKELAEFCDQEMIACSLDGQMVLVKPEPSEDDGDRPKASLVADLRASTHSFKDSRAAASSR